MESLNLNISDAFKNRSWVDIMDEEELKQSKALEAEKTNETAVETEKAESSRRGRKNVPTKNAAPRCFYFFLHLLVMN